MGEKPLKSSYELAMEKLRTRDREKGVARDDAVTEEQKKRIADVRTEARAKLAELEILWKSKKRSPQAEPETLEKAELEYVADRKRIEEKAEREVEKIRRK